MNRNRILIGLIVLSATASIRAETTSDDAGLRIYLPREITIEGDTPTLGQVAILRGNESLTEKAGDITLGYLSIPDQDLVINQKVVLSRLACNGIDVSNVSLTGASEVTVRRRHERITCEEIVTNATDFMKNNPPDKGICQLSPIRLPDAIIISGSANAVDLASQMVSLRGNQCKIRTTAFYDGKVIATRDSMFLCQYKSRKIIAKNKIAEGEILSRDNVTIKEGLSNTPERADWTPPYGLLAKCSFEAGSEIKPPMISNPTPPVVLKRNQTVVIQINHPGFVASVTGKALQDGSLGEYIKVQNVDSQKIIMAKVIEDGTVKPVF